MIGILLQLIGAVGVFLFGMRVMSDGIQKVAGERLQAALNYMTSNRVIAVLTGVLVTGIIQSSSATTVMVVGFTNAGLLKLTQAIGVIFGANIGTTVTTWLVSFLGFKAEISLFALPIVGFGFPFILSKYKRRRDFGEMLVGFGLLFLGLGFLKNTVPDINAETLCFIAKYSHMGFVTLLLCIGVGIVMTTILESSSVAMAITVTLAYKGYVDFESAAAICLGQNIGTTIKVFIVSIGTSVNARRAARSHFLFNLIGVIWVAFVFRHFSRFVLWLAPWDTSLQANLPLSLALFHSVFNISNTLLFLPFLGGFANLIETLFKPTENDQYHHYQLQYISTGVQDAVQLNILNARAEVNRLGDIIEKMFDKFLKAFLAPDRKIGELLEEVKELEELTDQMQEEISKYLVKCYQEELSEANVRLVNAMMRIVHELENVADSIFKLTVLSKKKFDKAIDFQPKAGEDLRAYSGLIKDFLGLYRNHLSIEFDNQEIEKAYHMENEINLMRDSLSKSARKRIQKGSNVKSELLYMDLVKNLENIGDNSLNIAQALRMLGQE